VLIAGCAGVSNGAGAKAEETPPSASFASCKAHLDAIADCFFKVVTQIQEEPKDGEPMAAFLGKATWQIAAGRVHAACSPLGLTEKSTRILLEDGSEVTVEKHDTSRDEMFDGETIWYITYRFSSPTCPGSAEANIELHMGGPVE